MTDWVFIDVYMRGPIEDLLAFRSHMFRNCTLTPGLVEVVIDFEQIIPLPHGATLQQTVSCWGCGSIGTNVHFEDIQDDQFNASLQEFKFRFDTPWRYPQPVFLALNKRFPRIFMEVEWEDRNGGVGGNWEYGPGGVAGDDWIKVSKSALRP